MLHELLERLALALEDLGIPYMIIGGQAVLLYGEPRFTRDVDVTLGAGPEKLDEILRLVKACNWRILIESAQEFVERTMVLPCLEPSSGMGVDFIFSHSLYERQALDHARIVDLGKAKVRFASLEDLVIHKVVAGRPRDLEDVRIILLKNPKFDRDYIEKWLSEFERGLSEPFVQRFGGLIKSLRPE